MADNGIIVKVQSSMIVVSHSRCALCSLTFALLYLDALTSLKAHCHVMGNLPFSALILCLTEVGV